MNQAGIQVVGCAGTWEELSEWLQQTEVDAVAANLDDTHGVGMNVVERLTHVAPQCGIIGVSARTEPSFIISAMRSGCSQFVVWPVDSDDLAKAVDRMTATRRSPVPTGAGKRFCVVGSSGGVGTTAIACNLAMELGALADRTTTLVDMNLEFGDINCAFDCSPTYTIADVCCNGIEPDHMMIEKALHALPCNVSILARPERIEQAREVSPEGVQAMLKILAETHPFVVVDLPRIFSFLSVAAVTDADRVLIVTQLSVPCIRNAARIYQCLAQMGAEECNIEIVLNRCNASFERITEDEVSEHFKKPVFASIPNDYRSIQASLDLGHPVAADARNSPARTAIQEMARKLSGSTAERSTQQQASGGLFGRLWKRSAKA